MHESRHAPVALLFNGVWSQYAVATSAKYRPHLDLLHVHDLGVERLRPYRALIIPFQSNHHLIEPQREALLGFLARGLRVAVFGDASAWIGANWADRPVDNYWWAERPHDPPVAWTDFSHPLFDGLGARQAGWHHHGVYLDIPNRARVLQRSRDGEVVTWVTREHGGHLLAATSDPIVEHGIQQIRHLDHFVDRLIEWLGGGRPHPEPMVLVPDQFQHQAIAPSIASSARSFAATSRPTGDIA
ncbi:hypothetical protein [Oleiagrimonas sp.]|jgi:hypothetical protein|uniref:hypothetical protein n=1 Tax=Oleiagrimonas sp. TaxID=2010330 RepID=UPI00261C067F|nr:hypothetical protein [Oleiagrimonas sp.]MDA3914075.1 hypothetical protein [Oleiagrimonas sp.]